MHPEGTNFCMHFMYKIQSSSLKCENYSILMYYKQYNIFPAHAKTENEKFSFLIAHFSHSHDTKNTGYTNWKWKKKFWLYNIYKYGVQYTEQELSRTFYVLYTTIRILENFINCIWCTNNIIKSIKRLKSNF